MEAPPLPPFPTREPAESDPEAAAAGSGPEVRVPEVRVPEVPVPGPFELSGGALCLDYVNTWGDRERPESDDLRSYADLLRFAFESGLLDEGDRRALAARPAGAAAAFATALRLRESLYLLFAASARSRSFPAADLETLNGVLAEALAHLRIVTRPAGPDGSGAGDVPGAGAEASGDRSPFAWRFAATTLPTAPLWPIARSAADLLVSPELGRVTQCDGARCTWLFLDLSRTGNRRWCSMQSCGNRAKAQRHYRRHKV